MRDLFEALNEDYVLLDAMIEINRLQSGVRLKTKAVRKIAMLFRTWLQNQKSDTNFRITHLMHVLSQCTGKSFRLYGEVLRAIEEEVKNLEKIRNGSSDESLERSLKFCVVLHRTVIAALLNQQRRCLVA